VRDVWVENKKAKDREGWNVKMLGTVPVLEGVDSHPRRAGPEVGEHAASEVLMNDLGLSAEEVSKLREGNAIG
jgi:crotonobetainyl-CoA:carnitine CoA-transferase CaiB-like acyl-CoA transferase